MSKRQPPLHSRFKPGQSGNPSGKRRFFLTIDKLREIIDRFQGMTRSELQAVMADQRTTMIELQVGSVIAKAAKDGDYGRMSALLDRIIGRVALQFTETPDEPEVKPDLKVFSTDELIRLVQATAPQAEEKKNG